MGKESESKYTAIAICAAIVLFAVVVLSIVYAPNIRASINEWRYGIEKVDDVTDYETLKSVEDTCRAYIASYEADKITYETCKDMEDEVSKETANAAKIQANRTAATYNSYYLTNSYVWKDSVPADIKNELPYLE